MHDNHMMYWHVPVETILAWKHKHQQLEVKIVRGPGGWLML